MKPYRKVHQIGKVEIWRHPEGHRFVRFSDSSMQGRQIPHPSKIPREGMKGTVNFVTSFKTRVGEKRQKVWAKEVGGKSDTRILKQKHREAKINFNKYAHHARTLRQLKAVGYKTPEVLGILHPNQGPSLMLTTHIKGKPYKSDLHRTAFEEELKRKGFTADDLHSDNVFENKKREHVIIDASRFGPTNMKKFEKAVKKQQQKQKKEAKQNATIKKSKGVIGRITNFFGLK